MFSVSLYVVKREASFLFYSGEMLVSEYLNMLLVFEHVCLQHRTAPALTALCCGTSPRIPHSFLQLGFSSLSLSYSFTLSSFSPQLS